MESGIVEFETMDSLAEVFGPQDKYLNQMEKALNVTIRANGAAAQITGEKEDVSFAMDALFALKKIIGTGELLTPWVVDKAIGLAIDKEDDSQQETEADVVAVTHKGKPVVCKTRRQKEYVKKINSNTITFCTGPAGTGKTYLAMALAVLAYKKKEVSRIVVSRPAVEAGEKLGYLPGDLQEKVDPYLTPLYDALAEFMGEDKFEKLEERGVIEAAPLAFMRGRTLKNCFVVLDEAQNCTIPQMKMFLTRLGENSKMVITGDITQTDLPGKEKSGLKHAVEILSHIEGIGITNFTNSDVVRHPLVQKIIQAYEKA